MNRKHFSLFAVVIGMLFLSFSACALAQSTGYVQIDAPAGTKIYLDGTYKGVTASDGLILRDVTVGRRTIRAEHEGSQSQEYSVTIKKNEVSSILIKPFVTGLSVREEGRVTDTRTIASSFTQLTVQTLPIECSIDIPTAGLLGVKKTRDKWIVDNIPSGKHKITFNRGGKVFEYTFEVKNDFATALFADLLMSRAKVSYEVPSMLPEGTTKKATTYSQVIPYLRKGVHSLSDILGTYAEESSAISGESGRFYELYFPGKENLAAYASGESDHTDGFTFLCNKWVLSGKFLDRWYVGMPRNDGVSLATAVENVQVRAGNTKQKKWGLFYEVDTYSFKGSDVGDSRIGRVSLTFDRQKLCEISFWR